MYSEALRTSLINLLGKYWITNIIQWLKSQVWILNMKCIDFPVSLYKSMIFTIGFWNNGSRNHGPHDAPKETIRLSWWGGQARICKFAPPLRSQIPRATWAVSPAFSCSRIYRKSPRTFEFHPFCVGHCQTLSLPSVIYTFEKYSLLF